MQRSIDSLRDHVILCGYGQVLRELRERGLEGVVIAIKRGDEPIQLRPGPDAVLRGGDRVVAIGDRANLTRLAEAARPE
jgi:K+/H+ antiporter YhaU regulatory subunit KhtT